MLNFLDKSKYLLLIFLPFFIISGPFLADLAISIIGVMFLLGIFITKNYNYLNTKYSLFFFIFCLILIFCSINSDNIFISFESSLFYIRFGLFFLAVSLLLERYKNLNSYFFLSMLTAFSLLLVDGYYQYFTNYNLLGYHYGGNRLSGLFGEEQKLGNFLIRLLPLLLALSIISKFKFLNNDYFLIIFSILTGLLIIITGERNAIALLLIFIVLLFLIIIRNNYLKVIFLLLFSFLIALMLSQTNIKQRLIFNTLDSINVQGSNELYFISEDHEGLLLSSIKMFRDNILTGVGPKLYRYSCNNKKYHVRISNQSVSKSYCSTHPHSIYAQLFAETGILGGIPIVIFFLILFAILLKQTVAIFSKKNKMTRFQLLLIICIFLNLIPLIPSYSFFNNWISVIYYLPIGFLIYSINQQKKL